MGSNNSAKLDDPAATALGSDTGLGSDRMREFYSKGKRDRFLFRLNGSIPYRSGFCTAIARFAGSFVIGNFDTGAYAPGFMLSPASQARAIHCRLPGLFDPWWKSPTHI